jgi:PIN domain nuclease of toxin-antitoxin system
MRLLLDTHIFIWLITDDKRLKAAARRLITSASQIFVSSASIWEIAIKARINKIHADSEAAVQEMKICGFLEMPVLARHAVVVSKLALLHNDPFDRLLVAQAISETIRLLTADPQLKAYSELVECV